MRWMPLSVIRDLSCALDPDHGSVALHDPEFSLMWFPVLHHVSNACQYMFSVLRVNVLQPLFQSAAGTQVTKRSHLGGPPHLICHHVPVISPDIGGFLC